MNMTDNILRKYNDDTLKWELKATCQTLEGYKCVGYPEIDEKVRLCGKAQG